MLTKSDILLEKRVDLSESQTKMWRTLIRVSILKKDQVGFIIPGRNVNEELYFNLNELPQDLKKRMRKGYRFHCPAHFRVERTEDLYIDIDSYEPD